MIEKAAIFTNIDYANGYIQMFRDQGYTCSFELCTDMLPSWQSQLKVWDEKGVDIAIIDEASFVDKDAMLNGIISFMSSGRVDDGHLRIIFFSASEHSHDDSIFSTLAYNGVYDFTIPQDFETDIKNLFSLVRVGNRRDQVITYIQAAEPQRPQEYYRRKGKETIAVASFVPRAGVTTTAIVLARTIYLAHREQGDEGKEMPVVGLGVSEEFFNSLAFGYHDKYDTKFGVFRINGLLVFNTMSAKKVPRCDYVVLDLGQLDLQKSMGENAGNERFRSFLDASCKVVCVPYTNFIEAKNTLHTFEQIDAKTMNNYRIAFWGIKDEFFDKMRVGIAKKAPICYPWKMPVSLWPMDLEKIDIPTLKALRDVLPRGYVDRYVSTVESEAEQESKGSPVKPKSKRGLFGRKG